MEPSTSTLSKQKVNARKGNPKFERSNINFEQSQVFLASILDSTKDLIWSVDPKDFGLVTFNKGLFDYFHEKRGISIAVGMRPEDLFPTEDYVKTWRKYYRSALKEGTFLGEYKTFSGTEILDLKINVLKKEEKVIGLSVFGRNITEQKSAETQMRTTKEYWQSLVENTTDLIIVLDTTGKIIYLNPSTERILGYKPDELNGQNAFDFVHPEDWSKNWEVFASYINSPTANPPIVEIRLRHKNGSWRVMETTGEVKKSENGQEVAVLTSRDITERKQAESLLLYQSYLLKNIDDAVIATDLKFKISSWNEAAERMYGWSVEEAKGKLLEVLLKPEYPDRISGEMNERLWKGEVVHHRKDGSSIYISESVSTVKNEDGFPLGLVLVNRDISESKRAQELLKSSELTARRTARQLEMINEIGLKITAGLDFERLMQTVYEECQKIGDHDTFYVVTYDDSTGLLSFPFFYKDGEHRNVISRNIKENAGLAGYIIEHRKTLYLADNANLPPGATQVRQPGVPTRSFIGIPLLINEKVIGVLSMQSHKVNAYSPEQIETLELIAIQVAVGVQNSQLYTQVQKELAERKQAEEQIKTSEEKFRLAFMTGLDAYYWATLEEGLILEINPYFEDVFGYSRKEVVGKTSLELNLYYEPSDRAKMVAELKAKGFVRDLEIKGRRKNGKIITISISVSSMQMNDKKYIIGVIRDITEKKEAEDALRTSENLFRTSFESSIAGISMISADGTFLRVNKKLCDILGYTREELFKLTFNDITYADDKEIGSTYLKQMISGEIENTSFEKRYIKKDGKVIWVFLSVAAIFDKKKQFQYLVTYTQDITDSKTSVSKIRKTLEGTVETLALIVEARDPYTSGHQKRVAEISVAIARDLGLPDEQVQGIYFASIIHDLGKIQVPAEILSKPGKLTELEFEMIKTHPKTGYELLKNIDFPWPIAEIIYQHHERVDGSGYPRKLKGEQVLIEAKIISIADVIEAMSSHRPYRPALGLEKALEEIDSHKGTLYDREIVKSLFKVIKQGDEIFTSR